MDWYDLFIEDVLRGVDPLEAIATVKPPDHKERWYAGALAMVLRARNDPDTSPGRMLTFLRELGYPLHDVLHVAMLFETLLLALAAIALTDDSPLTEREIRFGAERMICDVEDYLKSC